MGYSGTGMIVFASGQLWKMWLPTAAFAVVAGGLAWTGIGLPLVLILVSPVFLPVSLWSWYSVRCPRCGERWLWNQATKGTTPSLEPVFNLDTCPRCGIPAAEMKARRPNF
jgi:hypothetical protein